LRQTLRTRVLGVHGPQVKNPCCNLEDEKTDEKTVIRLPWALEDFFQGGAPGDFSKIFPRGAKNAEV